MADFVEREKILALQTDLHFDNIEQLKHWKCCHIDPIEVELLPAADVRPVVLCRDCDCWNDWDSAGKESLGNYVCSCAHWTVEDGVVFYTRPTDFCSYGEKREES